MVGAGSLMIPGCTGVSSDPPFNPISATAPHAFIGGDTADGLAACHNFRWKRLAQRAEDASEVYDLVIIGAGLGGLTAAFYYHQERPEAKILLLDGHADFGGNAQRNEMTVKGQKIIVTQAGDYQWAINPEYKAVKKLWADLGIDLSLTSNLKIAPEAYQDHMFMNGEWIMDFWETGYNSASSPWSKKFRMTMMPSLKLWNHSSGNPGQRLKPPWLSGIKSASRSGWRK